MEGLNKTETSVSRGTSNPTCYLREEAEDLVNRMQDPLVCLNVGGQTFYVFQSTLTSGSAYFAARFSGRMQPGGIMAPCGNCLHATCSYFVDRDPDLFKYVLKYLHTNSLSLPEFNQNPGLWRELRLEAIFYGIDGLSALLEVTYSCSPDETRRGVLYWIGTEQGKKDYQNPFTIGAIHVGGWVDRSIDEIKREMVMAAPNQDLEYVYGRYLAAGSLVSRANFVQYCLRVDLISDEIEEGPDILLYDDSRSRNPVVVDLRTFMLRPTHYSLRFDHNFGEIGDRNFEASHDGSNWVVLHEARECHSYGPSAEERHYLLRMEDESDLSDKEKCDFLTTYMEQRHRYTWALEPKPTQFYRYFRIIGAGEKFTFLGGPGLELFGDVHQS